MRKKPRPIEFMLRGIDVADALAILERWDSLSPEEREALGFKDELGDGEAPQSSSVPSATFH